MSSWTVPRGDEGWAVPGFTAQRELGGGVSGRIVEAVHDASGRWVAVKFLNPDLLGEPAFLNRFRAEARRLHEFGDPHGAVRVYDYVEHPGQGAAIVLDLAGWDSLDETIEKALLPLLTPAGGAMPPSGQARPSQGGGRRRLLAIASVAAGAVLVLGGVAAAVTLTAQPHSLASQSSSTSRAATTSVTPSFKAVANVLPPVATSKCTAPTAFTYSGTLSATTPGIVKYQWVYSSGQRGPVQAVTFAGAGRQEVTGETVKSKAAGGGWGEIKVLSPAAQTSNEASYRLLCGGGSAGGLTVTAAVTPAARTSSCAGAPPSFAATGSVKVAKAASVTYYWALSDGATSARTALTFAGPGAMAVKPLTIRPPDASGTGEAVLVVTSPVTVASAPATYTFTCSAPAATPPATSPPATGPAGAVTTSPTGPGTVPASAPGNAGGPQLTITDNAPAGAVVGEVYAGAVTVSGGTGPYAWNPVSGLPSGLTASASGATLTVSGTPSEAGDFAVMVEVTDSSTPQKVVTERLVINVTVSQPQSVMVFEPPIKASIGTVGLAYQIGTIVTGGKYPYTWNVTGLPPGLSATPENGGSYYFVVGTPTTTGTFNVTATVTDGESPAQVLTMNYPITISPVEWAPDAFIDANLTVGPYTNTFVATAGVPVTWAATGLPPGLSLDSATGVLSGTLTTPGNYYIVVSVTDTATGVTKGAGNFNVIVHPAASSSPSPT